MKRILLLSLTVLFTSLSLSAQEVTREEFSALLQRIAALERSLASTRNMQMESLASHAIDQLPAGELAGKERETFIQDVVTRIQQKEESANYPWMEEAKWENVRKRMSPEQVISILGQPTLDEPSLHKRKDRVFTWEGRRVATGEKVEAVIRFYKGKVIEIEPPSAPKGFGL